MEGAEKLTFGVEFLKKINRGEKPFVGKNTVVIVGGNSGMDVATSAYEQGAEKVIVSIGEAPILDFLPNNPEIKKFRDWLVPDAEKKILPKVFAAGDVIKPSRLTDAIGDARKTALMTNQFLNNEPVDKISNAEITQEYSKFMARQKGPASRWFEKCHHCEQPDAMHEHLRCVSCGTCRDCKMCLNSCPEKAINRIENSDGTWEYFSDEEKCIGCGICAGVCPCGVWNISENPTEIKMYKTYETSA